MQKLNYIFVILILMTSGCQTPPPVDDNGRLLKLYIPQRATWASVGTKFPNLAFNYQGGDEKSIDDFKGKVLWVNFWAAWCDPCRAEWPSINAMYEKVADDPRIVILPLNAFEDFDTGRKWVEQQGYSVPLAKSIFSKGRDNWLLGANNKAYRISGSPQTFVVNKKGVIVAHFAERNWHNYDIELKRLAGEEVTQKLILDEKATLVSVKSKHVTENQIELKVLITPKPGFLIPINPEVKINSVSYEQVTCLDPQLIDSTVSKGYYIQPIELHLTCSRQQSNPFEFSLSYGYCLKNTACFKENLKFKLN